NERNAGRAYGSRIARVEGRERKARSGRSVERPRRVTRFLDRHAPEGGRQRRNRTCLAGRLMKPKQSDPLVIAGRSFQSRLFLGTAGYSNQQVMLDSVAASGTEMATASIRRISLQGDTEGLIDLLGGRVHLLPNTAGCQTAKDAVLTAELAREALQTNWVKLE